MNSEGNWYLAGDNNCWIVDHEGFTIGNAVNERLARQIVRDHNALCYAAKNGGVGEALIEHHAPSIASVIEFSDLAAAFNARLAQTTT